MAYNKDFTIYSHIFLDNLTVCYKHCEQVYPQLSTLWLNKAVFIKHLLTVHELCVKV
jgi:hypothetical protein